MRAYPGHRPSALRSDNELTALPESFGQLTALTELKIDGNPLERPPLAVCENGVLAIARYFNENPLPKPVWGLHAIVSILAIYTFRAQVMEQTTL